MRYDQLDKGAEQRTLLSAKRTQLASERTFLAWIRTGLACIGGGVAFDRLLEFHTPMHEIAAYLVGVLLIFLGMGIFFMALWEYEKVQKEFQFLKSNPLSMRFSRLMVFVLFVLSGFFLALIS